MYHSMSLFLFSHQILVSILLTTKKTQRFRFLWDKKKKVIGVTNILKILSLNWVFFWKKKNSLPPVNCTNVSRLNKQWVLFFWVGGDKWVIEFFFCFFDRVIHDITQLFFFLWHIVSLQFDTMCHKKKFWLFMSFVLV